MKKILFLLVALLLVGSLALAESIDLGSLTDDELLALHQKIEDTIDERGLSSNMHLPNGEFVVGVDIKPGKYVIHVPAERGSGWIYIYANEEKKKSNDALV